jgi:hypothetical protein
MASSREINWTLGHPPDATPSSGVGTMKSNKQRRAEMTARRSAKRGAAQKAVAEQRAERRAKTWVRAGGVPVKREALAKNNSYGEPQFVRRGYYLDVPFICGGCGSEEVWTAAQQKWWYEVAKGYAYSTARLCQACRRKERDRRAEARRLHLEGIARKRGIKNHRGCDGS